MRYWSRKLWCRGVAHDSFMIPWSRGFGILRLEVGGLSFLYDIHFLFLSIWALHCIAGALGSTSQRHSSIFNNTKQSTVAVSFMVKPMPLHNIGTAEGVVAASRR